MRTGDELGGRFLVQGFAGSGGMGDVFRAVDQATGRACAIKVLRLRRGNEQRFAREARLLADIDHPNVVRHVAHGTTEHGEPYLVMDWIEGESLEDRLARGPLGVAETVALARAVAAGLSVAHRKGVVHRDLKPANLVLVDGSPARATIIDFGLARAWAENSSITVPGAMVGTPDYMAPEQARGEPEIDARADVFALGCVLYACLAGRPPFFADNPLAVLVKTVLEDAPRVSEARPGVPYGLDQLLASMLSKSPSDRPKDAGVVLSRLAELGDVIDGSSGGAASLPVSSLTARERRIVCLVLARPRGTGITRPGDTLVGSVPPPALVAMRDAVSALSGSLEILADGSLLVTTPAHGAATDQAARAARCALAVRAHLADVPIALVAGQATWPARVPLAQAVERALALLDRRSSGGGAIYVDEVAASLLAGRFDVEETSEGAVLHAERATVLARTVLGRAVPCIGRDREIAALEAALAEVAEESVARVVIVTGAAGIGKTRVCQEFVDRALRREVRPIVLFARGDPMYAGAPLRLCAEVVRRASAPFDSASPPSAEDVRALAAKVPGTAGDRERVAEFLAELARLPLPKPSVQLAAARRDPVLLGDQMRRAWEDWIASEASQAPVLLWLDDLQWGDLPSIKFVDAVLRNSSEQPILVLAAARPDVEEAFPELWADRDSMQLRMGELTRRAAERLVRTILGTEIDDAIVAGLVERSAGNAFYLEELARNAAAGAGGEPPESVIAMVQARLESLEPDARKLLRAGSIFGQTFRRDAAIALCGGEREAPRLLSVLDDLVERELVTRAPTPAGEYAFRHTLVREAAYAMLTDDDRVLGHRLAGEALESEGHVEAAALAEHFERGKRPGAAARWYGVAAEQALAGNDLDSTLSRVARACACLDADDENVDEAARETARGKLLLVAAEAHRWRGDMKAAAAAAREAMKRLEPGSEAWCVAAGERGTAAGAAGDVNELEDVARELRAGGDAVGPARVVAMGRVALQLLVAGRQRTADDLLDAARAALEGPAGADPVAVARMHQVAAIRMLFAGDPGGYLEGTRAAYDGFVDIGDLRNACLQGGNLGFAYAELGAFAQAEQALAEALARAERLGLSNIAAVARHNLGLVLARLGRIDEARRAEKGALEAFEKQRDVRMECAARVYLADVLLSAGDVGAAVDEARRARDRAENLAPMRCLAGAMLARALLARGSLEEAEATAEEAGAALEELGGIEGNESIVWLARAETAMARGNTSRALALATRGKERLVARAAKIENPAWRASFLERVPENAALVALADRFASGSAAQPSK